MNKERMLELADILEYADPKQFHFGSWFGYYANGNFRSDDWVASTLIERKWDSVVSGVKNELTCGTTACIAGWATAMKYNFSPENKPNYQVYNEATEYLDLTHSQAHKLFYADEDSVWFEYQDEYDYEVYWIDEFGDPIEVEADRVSITNKDAASIIRRIVNGEIEL